MAHKSFQDAMIDREPRAMRAKLVAENLTQAVRDNNTLVTGRSTRDIVYEYIYSALCDEINIEKKYLDLEREGIIKEIQIRVRGLADRIV